MVTVEHSVIVERSIEDVFEFVTDDRNIRLCQLDTVATRDKSTPGWSRCASGEVRRFRGRDPLSTGVCQRERNGGHSDSDSFPFDGEHILEPLEGATRYTLIVDALLVNMARRQMETSLNRLKAILEGREYAPGQPVFGLSGSWVSALGELTA